MAKQAQKNLIGRLADAGEEAIQRLAEVPGGESLLGALNSMRNRMDEMQRRLLGLDALEGRVAKLEQQVSELSDPGRETRPAAKRTRSALKKGAGEDRDPGLA